MKHFPDLNKIPAEDIRDILDLAKTMKAARQGRPKAMQDDDPAMAGRMVALIFEKPSTRTRVSFDVGVRQLGGQTMVLSGAELQLGHGESIADTARVLSRFVDLIMVRTFKESVVYEMIENASVPVINGLTDRTHPCQIMADIMTFEEHRGSLKGKTVAWMGDGNNVCASLLHGAAPMGYNFIFAGPEALDPEAVFIKEARQNGVQVEILRDAHAAAQKADLIVTDTWLSMHDDPQSRAARFDMLKPYQVNEALMQSAKDAALFMHCLPAHRGEEVTDAVMDGPQSVVFDEAENRLHVQKAIMRWCLGV